MPHEPILPPIDPGDYRLEPFRWCQIVYLYARELFKSDNLHTKGDWNEALSEAVEVAGIMENGGVVIAPAPWLAPQGYIGDSVFGYTDLVHWPSMVCAANVYASLPPGARARAREAMAQGVPPVYVETNFASGGCDQKVLEDPEYRPAPPCLPADSSKAGWIIAGVFTATIVILSSIDRLIRSKS